MQKFQSTHPHGVRLRNYFFQLFLKTVSIHAPARGATHQIPTSLHGVVVSIHAPARGATSTNRHDRRHATFQSTHPHGVRLHPIIGFFNPRFVSIHAPARGATRKTQYRLQAEKVSIHAPARGATNQSGVIIVPPFVSIHAPARGATFSVSRTRITVFVSIHAPARGATQSPTGGYQGVEGFNPRTRTGCDVANLGGSSLFEGFNPRTRTGCDWRCRPCRMDCIVSIHAPARGATNQLAQEVRFQGVSIHAPARGATFLGKSSVETTVFQSTHPHGVRLTNT